MRTELSRLARLVITYYVKFGRHVPEMALRTRDAEVLASIIEFSLATGMPMAETGWEREISSTYSRYGCCIDIEESEQATCAYGPRGEWLH